jgi:hypothetical protein
MQEIADFAINTAKDRYGQELDFSEPSIDNLDNILSQIHSNFSNIPKTDETTKAISDTAVIWGSYLGEYMCRKWGGTWILKGEERLVTISNIDFTPISFIYQKITSHPEYSVNIYLLETKKIVYLSVINPKPSQTLSNNVGQPDKVKPTSNFTKHATSIKRSLRYLAVIGVILVFIFSCYFEFISIRRGGLAAFNLLMSKTNPTPTPLVEATISIPTRYAANTQIPTMTTLPTYTPKPTYTLPATYTPFPTSTKKPTLTPSITPTPLPTQTRTPTAKPFIPTDTKVPPTEKPAPTPTFPEPVVLESCDIDPSAVPININTGIRLIVHFSGHSAGYGFDTTLDPDGFAGQSGCSGVDNDGDGRAYCSGSSGELPESTTVYVTFSSSAGECVASYRSQ